MSECFNVGLFGLGNVGSGVVSLLNAHRSMIEKRVGRPMKIRKAVVSDISRDRGEIARGCFGFESSVGTSIPIIRTLREGFAGDEVQQISGIFNGTSNYILTRMSQDNTEFKGALGQAQAEGLAEPDPTLDMWQPGEILPMDRIQSEYYLRFRVRDILGVLAGISKILAENRISVRSVIQEGRADTRAGEVDVVLVTHTALEADVQIALARINTLDFIAGQTRLIRIHREVQAS